jgi:hypothetical protein
MVANFIIIDNDGGRDPWCTGHGHALYLNPPDAGFENEL